MRWTAFIFPDRCPVCDGILDFGTGPGVCRSCRGLLSFVDGPACLRCGRALDRSRAWAQDALCRDCTERGRDFDGGIALLEYNEAAREIMAGLKYHNRRDHADMLVQETVRRHGRKLLRLKADAMVPVPVHSERLKERGYDQAKVIASSIGRRLGIPVDTGLLIREQNTVAQKKLGYAARQRNEANAFGTSRPFAGYDRVILVDDIYTTGATAQMCTNALRGAGVKEVFLLNMAITPAGDS